MLSHRIFFSISFLCSGIGQIPLAAYFTISNWHVPKNGVHRTTNRLFQNSLLFVSFVKFPIVFDLYFMSLLIFWSEGDQKLRQAVIKSRRQSNTFCPHVFSPISSKHGWFLWMVWEQACDLVWKGVQRFYLVFNWGSPRIYWSGSSHGIRKGWSLDARSAKGLGVMVSVRHLG